MGFGEIIETKKKNLPAFILCPKLLQCAIAAFLIWVLQAGASSEHSLLKVEFGLMTLWSFFI